MSKVFKVSCSVDVYEYDDGFHECSGDDLCNCDDCMSCEDTSIQEMDHLVKAQSVEQAEEFIKKMYEGMSCEYLTSYNILNISSQEVKDLRKIKEQEVLSAVAE